MRKHIIAALVLAASAFSSFAQTAGDSPTVLGAVGITRDPVSMSMGAVSAAAPSFSMSALTNPAYAPFGDGIFDFTISGGLWETGKPSGTTGINFGTAGNLGDRFGYSFGLGSDLGSPYTVMDENGIAGGEFTPGQMFFAGGLAFRFLDMFSVGVGAKYYNQSLASEASYSAVAGNAFAMFQRSGLRVTAGVTDLGSKLGGIYALPAQVVAGADYSRLFGKDHKVEVAAEAGYYLVGAVRGGAGASYTWRDMLSARAGYIYGGASPLPDAVTAGLGFSFKGIHIDAAYIISGGPVGNSFTVGIGYRLKHKTHNDNNDERIRTEGDELVGGGLRPGD